MDLKVLTKIPVSNYFLSLVLKQTEFKEKIKNDFPRDYVLDFWLPCFDSGNTKASLVFCKDVDWHTDSESENDLEFHYSITWVLKTKNSKLEVRNEKSKVDSVFLKKGDLIRFKNCEEHRVVTEENNISLFLTMDFKNNFLSCRGVKLKLENFKNYIQSGNLDLL